jgi:three-Cys-motif partner protein
MVDSKGIGPLQAAGFNKIELFYFLAVGWLGRTLAATTKDVESLDAWWGRKDWDQLIGLKKQTMADIFVRRFKKDFGYKSVKPWPIYEKETGGNIMYYMIHATDHPEAPKLMSRAYDRAVFPEHYEQLQFESFFSDLETEDGDDISES